MDDELQAAVEAKDFADADILSQQRNFIAEELRKSQRGLTDEEKQQLQQVGAAANQLNRTRRPDTDGNLTPDGAEVAALEQKLAAVKKELQDARELNFVEDIPDLEDRRASLQKRLDALQGGNGIADGSESTESRSTPPRAIRSSVADSEEVVALERKLAAVKKELQDARELNFVEDIPDLEDRRVSLQKRLDALQSGNGIADGSESTDSRDTAQRPNAPRRDIRTPVADSEEVVALERKLAAVEKELQDARELNFVEDIPDLEDRRVSLQKRLDALQSGNGIADGSESTDSRDTAQRPNAPPRRDIRSSVADSEEVVALERKLAAVEKELQDARELNFVEDIPDLEDRRVSLKKRLDALQSGNGIADGSESTDSRGTAQRPNAPPRRDIRSYVADSEEVVALERKLTAVEKELQDARELNFVEDIPDLEDRRVSLQKRLDELQSGNGIADGSESTDSRGTAQRPNAPPRRDIRSSVADSEEVVALERKLAAVEKELQDARELNFVEDIPRLQQELSLTKSQLHTATRKTDAKLLRASSTPLAEAVPQNRLMTREVPTIEEQADSLGPGSSPNPGAGNDEAVRALEQQLDRVRRELRDAQQLNFSDDIEALRNQESVVEQKLQQARMGSRRASPVRRVASVRDLFPPGATSAPRVSLSPHSEELIDSSNGRVRLDHTTAKRQNLKRELDDAYQLEDLDRARELEQQLLDLGSPLDVGIVNTTSASQRVPPRQAPLLLEQTQMNDAQGFRVVLDPDDASSATNDQRPIRRVTTFDRLDLETDDEDDEFAAFDKMIKKEALRKEQLGIESPKIRDFSDDDDAIDDSQPASSVTHAGENAEELRLLRELAGEVNTNSISLLSGPAQVTTGAAGPPSRGSASGERSRLSLELYEFDRKLAEEQSVTQSQVTMAPAVPSNRLRVVLDADESVDADSDDDTISSSSSLAPTSRQHSHYFSQKAGTSLRMQSSSANRHVHTENGDIGDELHPSPAATATNPGQQDRLDRIKLDRQLIEKQFSDAVAGQRLEDAAALKQQLGFIELALDSESRQVNELDKNSRPSSPVIASASQSADVRRLSGEASRVSLQMAEAQRQSDRLAGGAKAAQRELDIAVTQNRFAEISVLTKQRDDAVQNFEEIRAQLQRLQFEQDTRLQRLQNLERQVAEQQLKQRQNSRRVGERVEVYSNTAGTWLDAEVVATDESTGIVSVDYAQAGVQYQKQLLPEEAQQSLRTPFRRAQSIRRGPVPDQPVLARPLTSSKTSLPTSNVSELAWKRELDRLRDLARIAKLEQEVRSLAGDAQSSMFKRLQEKLQRRIVAAADVDAPSVDQLLELRKLSDVSLALGDGGKNPALLTGAKSVEAWREELNKLEKRLRQAEKLLQRRTSEPSASGASDQSLRELKRQKDDLEAQVNLAKRVALPSFSDFVALQQASRVLDQMTLTDDTESQSVDLDVAFDVDETLDNKPFYDDEGTPLREEKFNLDADAESKVPSWKMAQQQRTNDVQFPRPSAWAISTTLRMQLDATVARTTSDGVYDLKQLIAQAMQIQQFLRNKQATQRELANSQGYLKFEEEKTNVQGSLDTNDTEDADLAELSSFSRGRLGTVDEKAELDSSSGDSDDEDADEGSHPDSLGEKLHPEKRDSVEDGQRRDSDGGDLKLVVDWVPRTEEELVRAVERREYGRAARLYDLLQRLRFGRKLPTDVETRDDGFVHSADDPWDYVYVNVNHGGRLGLGLRNSAQDEEEASMLKQGTDENDTLRRLSVDFPVVVTRVDQATEGFGVDGVLPGDRIVQVNGTDTKGASFDETLQMISSAARPLELTFLRFVGSFDAPGAAGHGTGVDDSVSSEFSSELDQQSEQQDSPPNFIPPESPTSRVEKARAALRAARERLDEVQASGPDEFGDDVDAFARRLAGLRNLQQELLRELQAAEADEGRLNHDDDVSTTVQPSTSKNIKAGAVAEDATRIDDLVEELQHLEANIQQAAAAGHFSDAFELGKTRSELLRSLQKARELRDAAHGDSASHEQSGATHQAGDFGEVDADGQPLTRRMNKSAEATEMPDFETPSRLRNFFQTQLHSLEDQISNALDHGGEAFAAQLQAQQTDVLRQMAEEEESCTRDSESRSHVESELGSKEESLNEVELQITSAIASGRFTDAVSLGKHRARLQEEIDTLRKLQPGASSDDTVTSGSSNAASTTNSADTLKKEVTKLEDELTEINLELTTAVASGDLSKAIQLSESRDGLQQRLRRAQTFANAARLATGGATTNHDGYTASDAIGVDSVNSARMIAQQLELELNSVEAELTNAVDHDQVGRALLLSQRRDAVRDNLQRLRSQLHAAERRLEGATAESAIVDDAEDVEYYDDEGNVLEVATATEARTESNNVSVTNQVDAIAQETDPLVLRATAVNLETKLREKDLEILSAIDANDFDNARELNQSKHNLQNILARTKTRLDEVQPSLDSDVRANGNENVGDAVARIQLELENVETEIASTPAIDDLRSNRAANHVALEQRRAVLRAELRELQHRAVARPASPAMGTIPELGEDPDTSDEFFDGDSDVLVDTNNNVSLTQAESSDNHFIAVAADSTRTVKSETFARETIQPQVMSKWVAIAAPLERELQSIEGRLEDELPASDAAKLRVRRKQLIERLKLEYQNAVIAGELADEQTTNTVPAHELDVLPTSVEGLRLALRAIERDLARATTNRVDDVRSLKHRRDSIERALASRIRERQHQRIQHQLLMRAEATADYQKAVRTDVGDEIALDLAARETTQKKIGAAEQSKPPVRSSAFSRNDRPNNWSSSAKLSDGDRSRIKVHRSTVLAGQEGKSTELVQLETIRSDKTDIAGDDQGFRTTSGRPRANSSVEDVGTTFEAVASNDTTPTDLLSPITLLSDSEKVGNCAWQKTHVKGDACLLPVFLARKAVHNWRLLTSCVCVGCITRPCPTSCSNKATSVDSK